MGEETLSVQDRGLACLGFQSCKRNMYLGMSRAPVGRTVCLGLHTAKSVAIPIDKTVLQGSCCSFPLVILGDISVLQNLYQLGTSHAIWNMMPRKLHSILSSFKSDRI